MEQLLHSSSFIIRKEKKTLVNKNNNLGNKMDKIIMTNEELIALSNMKYDELCSYLKNKYGEVAGSYFVNENCKTVNHGIKRTQEGLFIHHIAENQSIELSNSLYATKAPFEYQLGKNLVYCNYFEHLFLHIRIVKEFLKIETVKQTKMAVGIGGLVNFIFPEIIDYINGYDYKRDYHKKALSVVDGHEDFFIKTLFSFQRLIEGKKYAEILRGTFGKVVDIFNGKMIKRGRFDELVNDYAFSNKLFKYNSIEEIKEYVNLAISKGAKDIHFGFYKGFRGDNCPCYVGYYSKRGAYRSKSFRIYPKKDSQFVIDYIEQMKTS